MNWEGNSRLCVAASGLCGLGLLSSAVASPPFNSGRSSSTAQFGVAAPALTPFPTAIHHLDIGKADHGPDDRFHLPALVSGEENVRTMSQPEIIARRIHREGLPVARLWESRSALISIGLNQKGKPGLWLIQKVR
jgi:hypothetical protein